MYVVLHLYVEPQIFMSSSYLNELEIYVRQTQQKPHKNPPVNTGSNTSCNSSIKAIGLLKKVILSPPFTFLDYKLTKLSIILIITFLHMLILNN